MDGWRPLKRRLGSVPSQWKPLLTRQAGAGQARAARATFEEVLARPRFCSDNPSVAWGHAGMALGLDYLGRVFHVDTSAQVLSRLRHALEQVEEGRFAEGLFFGLSGVAWAMDVLGPRLRGVDVEDFCGLVDERVAERFSRLRGRVEFELQSGLAGDALYAARRLPRPLARRTLGAFVDWLEERSLEGQEGLFWRDVSDRTSKYREVSVELGMAHGMAGLLKVLHHLHISGFRPRQTRRLWREGAQYLFRSAPLQRPWRGSRYAARLIGSVPQLRGRVSWCKGDAGTFFALADGLGEPALERGRGELRRSLAEMAHCYLHRPDDGRRNLCCGDAGRAFVFQWLTQLTPDESVRRAALVALERTSHPSGPLPQRYEAALVQASAFSRVPPTWAIRLGAAMS